MKTQQVIEAITQLKTITFDGNLISKDVRDWLYKRGLVHRQDGYNFLSPQGIDFAKTLLLLGDE